MEYKAYAKINLHLEVEKKLDSGYHYLHMINAKVNLFDDIYIKEDESNKIEFSIASLNNVKNNIVLNILEYMQAKYNITTKYYIYIRKSIPQGAGLGGGSADGACIINALNELHNLKLSLKERMDIGIKFGADIPYCLINDFAYIYGIGENIKTLSLDIKKDLIIVYPNIFSSTKEVFDNNHIYHDVDKSYFESIGNLDIKDILKNDLETSAFDLHPELADIKNTLSKYGNVVMSGSGSTFLVLPTDKNSYKLIKDIYPEYLVIETEIIS